jgi:hypothetical protein
MFDLGPSQFLAVASDGEKTVLTMQSGGIGQQQSQQSSFVVGPWIAPPMAWELGGICHIRIQTQGGTLWLQAGRGQIGLGQTPPPNANPLPGRAMSAPPPIPEMPPMRPMEMPSMKPMEMRMGNMAMQMGDIPKMGDAPKSSPSSDLQQENLRLREDNLRLREELMALRQQLWKQKQSK